MVELNIHLEFEFVFPKGVFVVFAVNLLQPNLKVMKVNSGASFVQYQYLKDWIECTLSKFAGG